MKIKVVKKGVSTELKDCGVADFEIWIVLSQEGLERRLDEKGVSSLVDPDGATTAQFGALEEEGRYRLGSDKAQDSRYDHLLSQFNEFRDDGLGNFSPFELSGPSSAPPSSLKPIVRYLQVDAGATDTGTDIFIPPEDAEFLGLGKPIPRARSVRVAGGGSTQLVDYPTMVFVKVRFPSEEKNAMLRASSWIPVAGAEKIPTVQQYLLCYSGLNLLEIKVDVEDHSISVMTEDEVNKLTEDDRI